MVNFTVDQIRECMDKQDNIRNMSVIAHVDHGKSTLTDSLIVKAGIMDEDKTGKRHMDGRQDEQELGITIKSAGVSLYYDIPNRDEYLVNLIDTPGHVDFSSEVSAALRVTDGALVIVDCVEGVCVQTKTVLRQALRERVKPVLMINKIDKNFLGLQQDSEMMYQAFLRTIEQVNVIISTFDDGSMGDIMIDPLKGNVVFGSGLMGWAFSLQTFAKLYSTRFGIQEDVMLNRLWGENYLTSEGNKWKKKPGNTSVQRGFCKLVLDPIRNMITNIQEENLEVVRKRCDSLGIQMKQKDWELTNKELMFKIMKRWLNAADCILDMIIDHLPSPRQAQAYRTEILYEGPLDDNCAESIRTCDPNGPLVVYISKMIPNANRSQFIAFGRVFSGTLASNHQVRIMGANFKFGSRDDLFVKQIQKAIVMMGKHSMQIGSVPCGSTVGILGIDKYLVKTGTLSDSAEAHPLKSMKYSVSPVVRVAVRPKNSAELFKLVDGLKKLAQSDPLLQVITEETGEQIIAGSGELHMEVCLRDLREFTGIEIITSEPIVSYKETVTGPSSQVCLSKSQNMHNRLFMTAEPLAEGLAEDIENGIVGPTSDPKERGKILIDKYGWDSNDVKKIWAFGPENTGANMLVEQTKAIAYLQEIKDSMTTALQWAMKNGPLCEESIRGVRFNLVDAKLHADAIHRGGGQIIPAARRAYFASFLTAPCTLQEPMFEVEIQMPPEVLGKVYQVLTQRRGIVHSEEPVQGTNLLVIKGFLPVSESFGFASHLREETSGQAFPQCVFDHWETLRGDALEEGTRVWEVVNSIRTRKGLSAGISQLDRYLDKM